MLRRVNRGALVKRLCVLAALAGAAVCALEGFPDAAAGVDGGEPAVAAVPETETGPGPAGSPTRDPVCCRAAASVAGSARAAPGRPDGGSPSAGRGRAPRRGT